MENGAADPLWESRWVNTVSAARGIPTVQVVKVDLASPTAQEQLAAHTALPTVRGVRDILNWHPDPLYTHRNRADLMTDPAWRAGLAAVAEAGLSFDLQVFPSQLQAAAALAADHGDLPIVLDHAGMPIERDRGALDRWKRDLTVFAAEPRTTVKISALGTNDHRWSLDSIRRVVLDTIDVFGPSRCMVGSNFPVDGLYSTFDALYSAFMELTSRFEPGERADLFAGTARRFYRMADRPAGTSVGEDAVPAPDPTR